MGNFKFEWVIDGNKFSEIFRPYSFQMLRKMYDWSLINNEISGRDSDDGSYKKYSENIILNDPENFQELMLIDYLCEVNSVKIMQKFLYINDYKFNDNTFGIINRALQSNMQVQINIDVINVDLSILENVDFHTDNEEQEETIFALIGEIIDKLEDNNNKFIDFDYYINSFEYLGVSPRVINIFYQIQDIISLFGNSINSRDYFYIVRLVRALLKEIPEALGRVYKERFEVLRSIVRHAHLWNKFKQTTLVSMAISQRKYNEDRVFLEEAAILHMENIVNNMIVPSDLDKNMEAFEVKLIKLERFFNERILNDKKNERLKEWIRARYTTKQGCFGIMELYKNINYFSLSGAMDYEGLKWSIEKNEQFEHLKNVIQSSFDFHTYIYPPMTDKILRYKEDLKTKSYLHIALENDTEGNFEEIKKYYSCCERKMQAKNNDYTQNKIFYARWEPCSKCIPALEREKGKIRIFALAKNYDDWIKNNKKSKFRECNLNNLLKTLKKSI